MGEFTLDKYLDYTNRRLLYLARLQGQASEQNKLSGKFEL